MIVSLDQREADRGEDCLSYVIAAAMAVRLIRCLDICSRC